MDRAPEMRPMVEAWRNGDHARLTDFQSGPLAAFADNLLIAEADGAGGFVYTHYGQNIERFSGVSLLGKSSADFDSDVISFFVESYRETLALHAPVYAVNKAVMTHQTHSWQRLLLPVAASAEYPKDRVVALVRPVAMVWDVLADFTRDTGFLGGTLEPIIADDRVVDFALLTLSDPVDMFGRRRMDRLSSLLGRTLGPDELDNIMNAPDGVKAFSCDVPDSMDRFGRIFALKVTGSPNQPIFSLSDMTEFAVAREETDEHKTAMEDFAKTASDWMWETDADNRFTMVTDAVFHKSGYRPDYYIGRNRFKLESLPENAGRFDDHKREIEARQPFRNFVYCSYAADNTARWSRINGVPRYDTDGTFVGYRGTGSNITAEVEARQAAEERKQAMEDFAQTASDWMWESDAEHKMAMITDAVQVQTGNPPSHYVGKSRFAFAADPDNAEAFAAHRLEIDAHEPFRDLVYKIKGADGGDRWLRVNGIPRFDANGQFLGYRGTGSNITAEIEAKRALEERNAAMEDFAQTASDWMWETDVAHTFTAMSAAVEQFTGKSADSYVGVPRFDLIGSTENEAVFNLHRQDIEARRPFSNFIYKVELEDGRLMWARANGKPRFAKDGTFLGYRGTGTNITDEMEAREQAARRAQELAEAHRLGRLGAWSFNIRTKMVTLSPEYLDLVGLPDEHTTKPLDEALQRFSPDSRDLVRQSFQQVLRSKGDVSLDVEWIAGFSKSMDLSVVAKARQDARGRVHEIFGTVQDITERKRAERALEALAFHDPLTGLGNRSYFSRELDGVLQRTKAGSNNAGLLLLDLDHFKEVNDSLGHAAGDELLRRVSERLSLSVGTTGMVFRLGGDEFAIIVHDVGSAGDLSAVARNVISAFSGTMKLNEGAVHISTSIGIVMLPAQTSDPEEGMRFADLALYEAKAEGRNRALLFHAGLDHEVQDRVSLARDLRAAIKSDALDAHYQLQIDVVNGKILGFEALARWNHPTRGPIPPSKFIPIAESSRLIADLGVWMVRTVCRQGRAWLDAGGAPLEMAVNLSVAQLWHRDVEADITNALEQSGFPPELLCVELTESVFCDDTMPRIQRLLSHLKQLGVKIALDDFGTGYSSLSYLNDLSFDKLKIDRSFVSNCDQNPEKLRLLQGIIGLGKGLSLGLVVEGVETEEELQVVANLGCECIQGFYFAKPKPFHEACLDAAQIEAEHSFRPVLWKDRGMSDGAVPTSRLVEPLDVVPTRRDAKQRA
ncbi:MAG: EAL domain-containing protein [Pseudomonadota bacterium]